STNFVVPTSAVMSGRVRVRLYHSFSLPRPGLISATDMFLSQDITLSTKPVMVTLGCADTGPAIATSAMTAKRKIPTRLITASSCGCEHLGYRRHDIQTITNTCRKQCDRLGFTPEPPTEASKTRLCHPPFSSAFSRSAA